MLVLKEQVMLYAVCVLNKKIDMKLLFTINLCIVVSFVCFGQSGVLKPKYLIEIKSEEYPIFSQAVFNGIYTYNSKIEYNVKLNKSTNGLTCILAINDISSLNAIKYYLSEYTMQLIPNDISKIDNGIKWKISTAKLITQKINSALENPLKYEFYTKGYIEEIDNNYFVSNLKDGYILIQNDEEVSISNYLNQEVVVSCLLNADGSLNVSHIYPVMENTVEIYIMSLCSYGQKAVSSLIHYLDDNEGLKTELKVRYIFSKSDDTFTSLHGELEVIENLVQICIRDEYPKLFNEYFLERYDNKSDSWEIIAKNIGFSNSQIREISAKINNSRYVLIDKEYNQNRKFNSSPTFLWEGEQIKDIRKLDGFKGINFNETSSCE